MARLIYTALTSLDGYVADEQGKFDWAEPDEEVHGFVNALERPTGTFLLGRRMYEVLSFWENPPKLDEEPPVIREFAAIWRAADKIVYSRTLKTASTARTRIEREFDPEAVRRMIASTARDLSIGGPELAALAIEAHLVDEIHLLLNPVIVGGGKRSLPANTRVKLELLSERRFRSGVVHVQYQVEN
ncbi:MAG TPA: dihydrofolate reductase family protein [Gemmatimonadaceae bacterium]|nr:dihydrofolate reductase family protein [Gemmatimonadaceae bacterium]